MSTQPDATPQSSPNPPTAATAAALRSPDRKLARTQEDTGALPSRMNRMHDTAKGWNGDVPTEPTAPRQNSSHPIELQVHMHEEHALQPVARNVVPTRGPVRSLVPRRHKHWIPPATNMPGVSSSAENYAPAHSKVSSHSVQGVSKVAPRSNPSSPVARSTRRCLLYTSPSPRD